jgi:hypothetical protein
VPVDELAGGEVEELGLVELRVEAEVEALQGLGGVEGSAPEAQAELGLRAAFDLVVEQGRACRGGGPGGAPTGAKSGSGSRSRPLTRMVLTV